MRATRGQTLVLFALTTVLLVLMVCITLSIGAKTKRKLDMQNVAETTAYSQAIATARTYNTASLLNRTMVSHWIAMAGNHALVAWLTETRAYADGFAGMIREFEAPNPAGKSSPDCKDPNDTNGFNGGPMWYACDPYYSPGPGACAGATEAIRNASYEFWHLGLAMYGPRNGITPGDGVNGNCTGSDPNPNTNCTAPRAWMNPGWGELDRRAAAQAKAIHSSIISLAEIQHDTWEQLEAVLNDGKFARAALNASLGRNAAASVPQDYAIAGRFNGRSVAWREAGVKAANFDDGMTHERPMAEAAMGSRGTAFLADSSVLSQNERVPRRMRVEITRIRNWLDANYNNAFVITYRPAIVSAFPNKSVIDRTTEVHHPLDPADYDELGWGAMEALAKDNQLDQQLRVVFYPGRVGCPGGRKVNTRERWASIMSSYDRSPSRGHHEWGHGAELSAHGNWPMAFGTCHQFHTHYDEPDDDRTHALTRPQSRMSQRRGILPGLGYVFPRYGSANEGGDGVWGQPKLPVMLTFENHRGNADPWDLTVDFELDGDAEDAQHQDRLQLGTRNGMSNVTVAMASGMAYYHRRGSWEEKPNLLNPFWRATLVPLSVDEKVRSRAPNAFNADSTPGDRLNEDSGRERPDVDRMLRNAGRPEAAEAYQRLIDVGFRGLQ